MRRRRNRGLMRRSFPSGVTSGNMNKEGDSIVCPLLDPPRGQLAIGRSGSRGGQHVRHCDCRNGGGMATHACVFGLKAGER